MIIEPQYDIARKFYQGCAQVYDADYHTPNDVLKPGFTDNNDLGRWGMINTRGNSVSSFWYTSMTPFIDDLSFAVRASPPYYESSFYHILRPVGTYAFSPGNLFGRDGNEFAGEPIPFSEGLMPVQFNYYVYINENGDKVFNEEFENARGFSDGMAAVQTDDKIRWGYIDMSGDMVLPDIYTYACEFNEGYAYVRDRLSAKGYLIDKAGNHYLEDLELNGITKFNENGYALGFKKEKVEVEKNNEKVWVDFYTYYIIHFNY